MINPDVKEFEDEFISVKDLCLCSDGADGIVCGEGYLKRQYQICSESFIQLGYWILSILCTDKDMSHDVHVSTCFIFEELSLWTLTGFVHINFLTLLVCPLSHAIAWMNY